MGISGGNVGRAVANTHTIFKVVQVIVLFPLAGWIVKLTYLLVPGKDGEDEKELADTVKAALEQIEEKRYEAVLVTKGVEKKRIRKYGFAFCGKRVLIGKA